MPSLRDIKQQIETTETIREIAQALGDIATSKIKQTRQTVTQNIYYFQQVASLYKTVKHLASNDVRYKAIYNARERNKIDKTLIILITSNQHFYGSLDQDLVRFYLSQTKNVEADRVLIGSSGKKILDSQDAGIKFDFFSFKKDYPDFEELKELSSKVFRYKRILAFHTKFITLLNQAPTVTNIDYSELDKASEVSKTLYITEPEISKIMDFFESQIVILLFQAIFLEVDIAHLAARMITMNQAEVSSSNELKKEKRTLMKFKKQILNLRILETYSGRDIKKI